VAIATGFFLTTGLQPAVGASALQLGPAAGAPGAALSLPVRIAGAAPVVGLQFDLYYPSNQVAVGPALPGNTNASHAVVSRQIGAIRRIVAYSPQNTPLPTELAVLIPVNLLPNSPAGGPTPLNSEGQLHSTLVRPGTGTGYLPCSSGRTGAGESSEAICSRPGANSRLDASASS
jgi:hypothetical protein